MLKKGFALWSRSRIIKVFWLFHITPLKGFTKVLILFTYYQRKGCRVKKRSFNLPLLVKPNEPISGIRLSSGISHNRKRIYRIDASARVGVQQLFDNLHDLCQMAFSLTIFSGLPFWYVAIRLLLSCCQPLLYPDQNPFAWLGFPSIQSPPVPCGTGSVCHQPVLHRYYGFIRPLLTHWSGFPR